MPVPDEPSRPVNTTDNDRKTKSELIEDLNASVIRGATIYKENLALWNTIKRYAERIQELEGRLVTVSHE